MKPFLSHSSRSKSAPRTCRRVASALHAALVTLLISVPVRGQTIIYVDTDAVGANDGTSWADAFVFLQDALAVAQKGDEVWVAEGVYRPDQGAGFVPGDREASFVLSNSVSVHGGFSGFEISRQNRDCLRDRTVLSGDLLGNDSGAIEASNPTRADNARGMIDARQSRDGEIRLDCLTISDANTLAFPHITASVISIRGPGPPVVLSRVDIARNAQYESPMIHVGEFRDPDSDYDLILTDVSISNNWSGGDDQDLLLMGGGAVLIEHSSLSGNQFQGAIFRVDLSAHLAVRHSEILNNRTGRSVIMGAKDNPYSIDIVNSRIVGNVTTGRYETGAIRLAGGHTRIVNSIVAGNQGSAHAGGLEMLVSARVDVLNSAFVYNTATGIDGVGAVLFSGGTSLTIANSIFWRNDAPGSRHFLVPYGSVDVQVANSMADAPGPTDLEAIGGSILDGDPLFRDPFGPDGRVGTPDDDYRLSPASPAVDAGNDSFLPSDWLDLDDDGDTTETIPVDLVGHPRIVDGGSGQAMVDIGPLEFDGIGTGTSAVPPKPAVTGDFFNLYPNPVTSGAESRLEWTGPTTDTRLVAYDVLGRRVQTVHSGLLTPGQVIRLATDRLDPGAYVIVSSSHARTRTLVVAR